MAGEVGLNFNLENSVWANSYKVHRLIQLAKSKVLDNEVKEGLFKAHFVESKNIDDSIVILDGIATSIRLNFTEGKIPWPLMLLVMRLNRMNQKRGILELGECLFFVIDNKYGISGAKTSDPSAKP